MEQLNFKSKNSDGGEVDVVGNQPFYVKPHKKLTIGYKKLYLVWKPVSSFNVLDNDGGIVVENNIGRSNHLQILVLKDHFVVIFLCAKVKAGVGKIGILPVKKIVIIILSFLWKLKNKPDPVYTGR